MPLHRLCLVFALLAPTLLAPALPAHADERPAGLPPAVVFARVAPSTVVVTLEGADMTQGSGVVVGDGIVVTNHHVVAGRGTISVRRQGKRTPAKLLAIDPKRDLALLEADDLDAPRVVIRASASLEVGETVFAIGAPHGLELSLSDGLVSALRDQDGARLVQTTTPVSPGSSGGGLFDTRGQLVGIITFSREGQGLNFAHPTEWVRALLEGKDHSPPAAASFTITRRPKRLICTLAERWVWGLFSGGLEVLATDRVKTQVDLADFDRNRPTLTASPPIHGLRTSHLVLDDMNRRAGYIVFGPPEPGRHAFYFVQDTEGRFSLTAWEQFDDFGRPRLRSHHGTCTEPDDRGKTSVHKRPDRKAPVTPIDPACSTNGLPVEVRIIDGPRVRGRLRSVDDARIVVDTDEGPVLIRRYEIEHFECLTNE